MDHTGLDSDDPFLAFRRDHSRVLERLEALDRGVLRATGPLDDAPLRDLVAHLERQFGTHMAAEDHVLYPALRAAFPPARSTLEPLLADHAELRQMLIALAALLREAPSSGREERLVVQARDLSDLLRLHIRREESIVLAVASRVLSRVEIAAMATGLDTYRNQNETSRAPNERGKGPQS
jgi:hemerythrin-like domain-containing protein